MGIMYHLDFIHQLTAIRKVGTVEHPFCKFRKEKGMLRLNLLVGVKAKRYLYSQVVPRHCIKVIPYPVAVGSAGYLFTNILVILQRSDTFLQHRHHLRRTVGGKEVVFVVFVLFLGIPLQEFIYFVYFLLVQVKPLSLYIPFMINIFL